MGKEKSSRNVVATEALANPTGSSGARMALQNHPKLRQRSQAFDITSTDYWCWLLARSRGRDLSMASPWKVHIQEQFLKRDPKPSATYTPGCRPEGRVCGTRPAPRPTLGDVSGPDRPRAPIQYFASILHFFF